ncbi:MAG TPA: response regulator, partial [bacterium]|nr:response regulator [bacterium]
MKKNLKKRVAVIFENELLKNFFENMFEKIEEDFRYFPDSPAEIIPELLNYNPLLIIIYYNDLNDELLTKIKSETLLAPVPILFYAFKNVDITLEDVKYTYIKLPINKEQFLIEFDKILNDKRYILIIDDSKIIHKQLLEILINNNYRVLQAYNGQEALEILEKQKPDIILTDIEMPIMNGYELCKAVKQNPSTEKIPIVILSSLTTGVDIDRGFDVGANDYLTKPVNAEELISRLDAILKENIKSTREKILVIDDSKTIRNMVIQGLEQQGFKVYYAVNGKDGLQKALECNPDLITTDYDMPIMNGWELCQELRKHEKLKEIPTIMLTSRDAARDRAKQAAAGVKAYLTKPFSVDKLLVIVERLIAESKMEREREILRNYVSDAAYQEAVKRGQKMNAKSEMRAKQIFATVMFTDIAQFTPTCEKLNPQQLVELLNEY